MVLLNFLLYAGMKKAEVKKKRLRSTSNASNSEIMLMGTADTILQIEKERNRWELMI